MISVKQLLPQLLNSSDWRVRILENWQLIVGSLKTRVRLEKIYGTTVVIGVYEAHWMQELFFLSKVLIASINKQLEKPQVTDLKFKLIEKKERTQKNKKIPWEIKSVAYELTPREQRVLTTMQDKELAQALETFLRRCMELS